MSKVICATIDFYAAKLGGIWALIIPCRISMPSGLSGRAVGDGNPLAGHNETDDASEFRGINKTFTRLAFSDQSTSETK
jgi:hypothetical protein